MKEEEINFIQNQIGYQFKNRELLIQAFTRRSHAMENGGQDNEVLEFIGDKVLDLVVVKQLAEEYGLFPVKQQNPLHWGVIEETGPFISSKNEGELTRIKAQLVQKATLAEAVDQLGIGNFLIMGKGDIEKDIQDTPSVKEDLFEAILGAIALDSNWDIETLQDCVDIMLNPAEIMQTTDINYVAEIQAWAQYHSGGIPFHRFEKCSMQTPLYFPQHPLCIYGETQQDTHYQCELQIAGVEYHFVGYGKSKGAARMDASRLAYEYLERKNLLPTIRDEIENPNLDDSISQLEILARRGYFSIPVYEFQEMYDNDGNPVWEYKCIIEEREEPTFGTSSSKKDAKKRAAYEMLQRVLDED
jgi:dsRNA-specific ribonuclease